MPAWLRATLLGTTVFGGLHGVVISAGLFFGPDVRSLAPVVLVGCMTAAYIYVTAVGVAFWRNPHRTGPLFWALGIQVPWISLPGFVYKFAVGLSGSVALVAHHTDGKYSAGLNSNWNLGSSCEIRLLQDAPVELGVNVAAGALLFFLWRLAGSANEPVEETPPTTDHPIS